MDQLDKNILVSVTGLTPQVVTETLYALMASGKPIPNEIHLITTAHGRNRAVRDLLDPIDGKFHAFCKEYDIKTPIRFNEETIHVIQGVYGEALTDIRTPEENECAANFIMRLIKNFCADEQAAVHVSIAGGRKSMGFLIGYALSIFGRNQDELSHVLTSEPFENNRDFYYPTKTPTTIFAPDGRPLNPQEAKVSLAQIPFIKLRSGLTGALLDSTSSFSETVLKAQNQIAPPKRLIFEKNRLEVTCGDTVIKLSPVPFAVYYWFAQLQKRALLPALPGKDIDAGDFLSVTKSVIGENSATFENIENATKTPDFFAQYFKEKRSLINKAIQQHLGIEKAAPYLIASNKKRLNIKYFIEVEADKIGEKP